MIIRILNGFAALALAVLVAVLPVSCALFEEPKMTPEGTKGVDPTLVVVNVSMLLNVSITGQPADITPINPGDYVRRFVIVAYNADREECRRQIVTTPDLTTTQLTIPVTMRLNALNYRLVVWTDYAEAAAAEDDLMYDTSQMIPVVARGDYTANTNLKDAFTGYVDLDLRPYADRFNASIDADIELTRCCGRYEIVATDLGAFRNRITDGIIDGTHFIAHIRYGTFISLGYNCYDRVCKNIMTNIGYTTEVRVGDSETAIRLGFDFVLLSPGEKVNMPVYIDVTNEYGTTVSKAQVVVPVEHNANTMISGRFLTAAAEGGGLTIDPGFDGQITVDVGEIKPRPQ